MLVPDMRGLNVPDYLPYPVLPALERPSGFRLSYQETGERCGTLPIDLDRFPMLVGIFDRSRRLFTHIPRFPLHSDGIDLVEPSSYADALELHGQSAQPQVRQQLDAYLDLAADHASLPVRTRAWEALGKQARAVLLSIGLAVAVDIAGEPIDRIVECEHPGVPRPAGPDERAYGPWKTARGDVTRTLKVGRQRAASLGYWPWAFADDPRDPWKPEDRTAAEAGRWKEAWPSPVDALLAARDVHVAFRLWSRNDLGDMRDLWREMMRSLATVREPVSSAC